MNELFLVGALVFLVVVQVLDYRRSPLCRWCDVRHRGRCIYNPRTGKIFANTNDGHFDYENPNE